MLQILLALAIMSCDDKEDPTPNPNPEPDPKPEEKINPVSQFAYDGMSLFYKWAHQMENKKPTVANTDPKEYFYSLRSQPDIDHGWSWITDDIEELLNGFGGKSLGFGYNLKFHRLKDNKIYALIQYVFPNTPAFRAGMKRLHLIGEINGSPISIEERDGRAYIAKKDIDVLYGNDQATFTLYTLKDGEAVKDTDVTVTPEEINTNPVLVDSIYSVNDKKIGYLFYTGFIGNYNEELFKSFSKFKSENITDLVLDLRYNRGGSVASAIYLASLIAPKEHVQNEDIFVKLNYNSFLNNYFENERDWDRGYHLGYYNKNKFSNPLDANLNLSKVYVIATNGSYSASELTPHCLRPYMTVVHIGNKTGGKYTASWTIHAYSNFDNRAQYVYSSDKNDKLSITKTLTKKEKESLKNWGMQPIVAIYTDKNDKDFSADNGLSPNTENRLKENVYDLKPLGDTKDIFLGQALYLITGDESYKPVAPAATRAYSPMLEEIEFDPASLSDKIRQESVVIDTLPFSPEIMDN